MPTGPKGEKRPADVIGNAVKIARIATGEEDDSKGAISVREKVAHEKDLLPPKTRQPQSRKD